MDLGDVPGPARYTPRLLSSSGMPDALLEAILSGDLIRSGPAERDCSGVTRFEIAVQAGRDKLPDRSAV